MADRGKSAARVDWQQAFLLTVAFVLALARPKSAHAFQPLDPNTWPFIPVPEVATSPNGGTTYGLMTVFLQHDDHGDVSSIIAPDITNNTTLGVGGDFRYLDYPSSDVHWAVSGGAQLEKAHNIDLTYSIGRDRQKWWSFDGELLWEDDPTERFYGVGNSSSQGNETNYATKQVFFRGLLGINVSEQFQLGVEARPRYVRIGSGAFDLPSPSQLFPKVKGLDGGSDIYQELIADYDTRDSIDLPTQGGNYRLFAGFADRDLGSSFSYTRFGTELSHYFPFGKRFVLAAHTLIEYSPAGNETPFWSLARLGGEGSDFFVDRATNRGFGTARFSDNNIEAFNAELRTRVYTVNLFQTKADIELAPFFDVGKVSHEFTSNPVDNFHPAGGMGFRAIADPFVVGFVDVGYGDEGIAIFSGIDYPF